MRIFNLILSIVVSFLFAACGKVYPTPFHEKLYKIGYSDKCKTGKYIADNKVQCIDKDGNPTDVYEGALADWELRKWFQ